MRASAPSALLRLPLQLLERVALAALLLLALVPRAREIGAGFERGFGGYQGAFFAIAAVNYERLGLFAADGYPVLNIDLPGVDPSTDTLDAARAHADQWFVYSNHPPTTGWLAWAALKSCGPAGWQDEWRSGRAPVGVEAALRLPFLLLHMLALFALWRVARVAFGAQVALIALALTVFLPVSALYGSLVNFENPSLPFVLFAVGCYGLFVRSARPRDLALMGVAFFCASCVTFAPVFFVPALCARSLWTRRFRESALVALVGGCAVLAPLLLHSYLAAGVRARLGTGEGSIWTRVEVLLGPLLDGSVPFTRWAEIQFAHAYEALGVVLLGVALIGLAWACVRALSRQADAWCARGEWPKPKEAPVDLALPLVAGGALYLFAFYRHTSEEQWPFWLYIAPAAALLAARAVHGVSLSLQRLRGGSAPLVLVVGSVMLFSLVEFESWRFAERAPGPRDNGGAAHGPEAPLPATVGRQLAELLPAGSVGLHSSALGLQPASAWYAWRSLLSAESPLDPTPRYAIERLGLGAAPLYFLLPDDPPESAASAVDALRRELGDAALESSGWKAWRIE